MKDSRTTSSKKRWLLFLAEACIVLLLVSQVYGAFSAKPDLDDLQKNFAVTVSTDGLNCLYQIDDRGWFGDGEAYSVWQCDADAPLLAQTQDWKQGAAFQQPLFQTVVGCDDLEINGYYLPQNLEQPDCYYTVAQDAEDYGDDQLLLIYTPQARLGDGLQYKNLLFVIEVYS